ncbi:cardiolipin synthase [Tropicimonas isoalkanivorans]|uniref:Cardiolipin synthase n=1 Tax=Tropicimonas isoalkanivorans TaxID=441112 RepID=A0A1I1DYG8_9RHOB|nr:cardiolipin synthase [Tropicimonas isoalkanivorans]SFB79951.1 cardiolipin synthase [Tropicimonas isoalkanivorans]
MWVTFSAAGYLVLELFALYFAYRAVSRARTPQGSLAWVLFLIMLPWLAVPSFLFFGHRRYQGYVVSRRDSAEVIAGLDAMGEHYRAARDGGLFGYGAFEEISEMPVVSGNSMELLIDGEAAFEAIFAAFDAAEQYILVQFYIIHDDDLGRAFAARLKAAADRGVAVRLLYDPVGSVHLPNAYVADLRASGVEVVNASAMRGPSHRFQINFRNHRKTVVVDGQVGFIGGLNVGDEYLGKNPKYGAWRDTHCRLRGPVVTQLQLVYSEDWHWATHRLPYKHLNWRAERVEEGMDAIVAATGPGDVLETGSLYFCACITRAVKRLWIASPYFVPDIDILTSLKLAAMRGVDVRILVPEVIDHRLPWLAAFAYFDEIREAGVQVWRYTEGFMHQKVLLVDDRIASVGTTNMDNRSCRLNFEATVVVFDERAAAETARMLEADFARAYLLETSLADQPLSRRLGAPFARLMAPVL